MIRLDAQNKRLSLFLIGFFGLSLISVLFSITNFYYSVIYKIFDINLLPNLLNFVVNSSSIANYSIYLTIFIIIIFLISQDEFKKISLGFTKKSNYQEGITYGMLIIICQLFINIIINLFTTPTTNNNQSAVNSMVLANPTLSFLTVVIIGPIVEEFTYRYGLFSYLKKYNKKTAYIITILIFALIHFEFTLDIKELINELLNLPSYLIGAVALSYAYDKTEDLSVSIIAHIMNNAISFVLMFV